MAAAIPFALGQQGQARSSSRGKYVTNASTRDESMDGTKFPLHRLEREQTQTSDAAAHNQQESERVKRVRERLRSFSGAQ